MRVLTIVLLLTLGALPVSQAGHDITLIGGDARPTMNNQRLGKLIRKIADKVQLLRNGIWHVTIDAHQILILTDENKNRMRIMMPIRDSKAITPSIMHRLMQANFDAALDARYAIANKKLWSAFIHPLSTLTPGEFISGVTQVINLHDSYGKTYTSGILTFRGGDSREINRKLYDRLKRRAKAI